MPIDSTGVHKSYTENSNLDYANYSRFQTCAGPNKF